MLILLHIICLLNYLVLPYWAVYLTYCVDDVMLGNLAPFNNFLLAIPTVP